jgi:hypothetical protein
MSIVAPNAGLFGISLSAATQNAQIPVVKIARRGGDQPA